MACPKNCQTCHFSAASQTVVCTQCQYSYTLLTNGQCFSCGSTPQTRACEVCTPTGECAQCYPNFTKNSDGVCFTDDYTPGEGSWGYVGANIGLACLLMLMLSKNMFKFSYAAISESSKTYQSQWIRQLVYVA